MLRDTANRTRTQNSLFPENQAQVSLTETMPQTQIETQLRFRSSSVAPVDSRDPGGNQKQGRGLGNRRRRRLVVRARIAFSRSCREFILNVYRRTASGRNRRRKNGRQS